MVARFGAGVRHWRARAGTRPLVVASHGVAMTLWLGRDGRLRRTRRFLGRAPFPDVLEVDLGARLVSRARGAVVVPAPLSSCHAVAAFTTAVADGPADTTLRTPLRSLSI